MRLGPAKSAVLGFVAWLSVVSGLKKRPIRPRNFKSQVALPIHVRAMRQHRTKQQDSPERRSFVRRKTPPDLAANCPRQPQRGRVASWKSQDPHPAIPGAVQVSPPKRYLRREAYHHAPDRQQFNGCQENISHEFYGVNHSSSCNCFAFSHHANSALSGAGRRPACLRGFGDHPVATFALGTIQRLVRPL